MMFINHFSAYSCDQEKGGNINIAFAPLSSISFAIRAAFCGSSKLTPEIIDDSFLCFVL